jgi:16S rRNA processing protein RimM
LRVVTTDGEVLGKVVEVLQPGANDVYVVEGERGELLVPATAEVIERIDVSGGEISITPLAGMLDESK